MTKPLDLKHIAFDDLHISTLNMRHKAKGNKPPDISDILPSVKQRGIRQPLLVRPEPTKDNKICLRDYRRAAQIFLFEIYCR